MGFRSGLYVANLNVKMMHHAPQINLLQTELDDSWNMPVPSEKKKIH